MNRPLLLAGLAALLGLAMSPAPAAAQSGYPGGNQNGPIRCESVDQRQRVCATGWRSAVLTRQLSKAQCIEGRSWGSSNGNVWVSNGCRAEFSEGRGGWGGGQDGWNGNGNGNRTIRCDSNSNRQQVCNTGWRSAVLVRQVSDTRCVEGRNWGSNNGSVWVNGGCRAEFAEGRGGGGWGGVNAGNGQTIRCESNDNRQRVCRTDWRRATLVRQLSKSQCIEGRSWGSSNGAVWVSDGCRAEFAEGRGGGWGGGGNGNWGGSNYSIECSSDDNRMRSCAWERRQGRPVLIQQLSRTQCVEGRNWGYNGNSVWVNGGCRARFGAR